jgi:hypothetical protein
MVNRVACTLGACSGVVVVVVVGGLVKAIAAGASRHSCSSVCLSHPANQPIGLRHDTTTRSLWPKSCVNDASFPNLRRLHAFITNVLPPGVGS